MFLILPILLWLLFSSPIYASPPVILQAPQEIDSQASASAKIHLFVKNKKNTPYYLVLAFCLEPCHNKFGKTWVGDRWIPYGEKVKQNFFPIVTDDQAEWEGEVGFSADASDAGYHGAGKYYLKVGYYTAKGISANWSEAVPITITETVADKKDANPDQEEKFLDITHLRSAPLETEAETEGIITVPPGILGKKIAYLEDDFSGIRLQLNDSALQKDISLGTELRCSGVALSSRGERLFKMEEDDSLRAISPQRKARSASKIACGERLDDWEGRLVRVEGELLSQSGSTFYLGDKSGRIKIYLKESASLEKPAWKKGDLLRITGIISQWGQLKDGRDNYRLMPRYQSDLVLVESATANNEENIAKEESAGRETAENGAETTGTQATTSAVLGATTLPETGATTYPFLLGTALLTAVSLVLAPPPPKRRWSKSSN